ncbi:coat protein [ssRNA phage SRR7976300_4]|uniref:Coat protein n=1 Tax=ssRNA phage SRR7976300_4 TaxID=2786653 RepID=A0A8S5L0D8_9VIRU|nr:coat protein [ssRNA phage SRR7976300_4]DAD51097.1 TPA_asm: coat protein [ssRNA phage SRR7976300_4]
MANIANIVVFDGAAVPVSHTLVPVDVSRTKNKITANWREQIASLPVYAQIRASAVSETLPSGIVKSEVKVVVPVMEAINAQNAAGYTAAPKVAYEDTYVFTAFAHPRSNITGRRLARQLLVNLLGNVSTSVAAATTGMVPDLSDSLVSPT